MFKIYLIIKLFFSSEQLKEILYPLYLYCLCNPNLKPEIFFLRDNLWSHILNISQHNKFLTCKILAWMQVCNSDIISLNEALLINQYIKYFRFKMTIFLKYQQFC